MKYHKDITILLLTYNSNTSSLYKTLQSIIEQKYVNMELIISDDGSVNFEKNIIEEYLNVNGFTNYMILDNKMNRGTVNNIRFALNYVHGKYVKFISPGDYFYDEYSVKKAIDFLNKSEFEIAFGRAIYYSDEIFNTVNKFAPLNIFPYKNRKLFGKKDNNIFVRNHIKYLDTILGASVILKTDLCREYIEKICKEIRLAEDAMYLLMIADGIKIGFFNDAFIYYEYGTGVSTDSKNKSFNRVFEEIKTALKIIQDTHPELKRTCLYTLKEDSGVVRFFRRIDRKLYVVFYGNIVGKIENYFFLKKHNKC